MARTVVHLVAAARPNLMKVAPVWRSLQGEPWCRPLLIHTGQHFDHEMSGAIWKELDLPDPVANLGVGGGSHAEQTARVMIGYERLLLSARPDWVVVVGDVNSTLACALVAAKLSVPIAHLEAGLRSFDRTMPEEINRVVTDALADLLWAPSPDAVENLRNEGIPAERIDFVGNVMIDTLEALRPAIGRDTTPTDLGLAERTYAVVTLHRPATVDVPGRLTKVVEMLEALTRHLPVAFPVHPRTRQQLDRQGLAPRLERCRDLTVIPPLGYVPFMALVRGARMVVTDSGGVQEETTILGVPCITLRPTTERPITIIQGTNRLVDPDDLLTATLDILGDHAPVPVRPDLWDGRTAGRVAESLRRRTGADRAVS